MPNYTLYYFNGRGRAEICRMMFAAAGVKYMDKRFEFNEWDKYRNDMPSMCVPVLDIDGKQKMPETMAICRYLAREFSFYPKSSMDMFRCDYIADCFYEIMHDYMRYYHWKNGRFRFNCNMVGSGMMGSGAGMMGSGPGMMGSGAGMMGSGAGMMGSGPGMMGSGPGMMGSGPGMMGSGPGMMSPDSSSMSSSSSSSMMSPDSSIMSPGAGMMSRGAGMSRAGGMMSPGMSGMMQSGMPSSGMMGNGGNMMSSGMDSGMMSSDNSNYDQYMYWRYMNSFNRIMPFMERTLNMRKSGSHFFMGDQMMWCDMMFYCCMENMYMQNQSMFSSYPKMMALYKRVASHPKICGYLKKRCNTSW